jgi:hypothetical protein
MSRWGNVKKNVSKISSATYWTELKTEDGDVYYFNSHTEETAWERPADMDMQHDSVEETKSKGAEVHGMHGDLKPLQKFRNKKTYDTRSHDHLKFKTTQAALVGHEKVKFTDFCYRIVPAQSGNPLMIEPARLMITSHAVYDFDIGQAEGRRLKPQRRLPLLAIKQLGLHKERPIFFFRLQGEKMRHAVRYYNPRADEKVNANIVNLMLRTYAVSTKLGLRKKYFKDDIPHSIEKLANDTKKLLAKGGGLFGLVGQAQAVAAFRGGLVSQKNTKCSYCNLDTTGDSGARRFGDLVYHLECDPRERSRMKEEANQALLRGTKPKVEKVTGTLAEARAKKIAERAGREEIAKAERDKKIAEIEREQKTAESDRQYEIQRRIAAQEAKMAEYEQRKLAVEGKLKCGGCFNTFTGGEYYNVLGAIWHPECFVCQECNCSFGNYGYFVRKSDTQVKGVKTLLPYCYDHSETSWMGKQLLWLGDYSANLRRKCCGKPPVNWDEQRGQLMSQTTSSSGGYGNSSSTESAINYYWVDDGNNLQGPIGANQLLSLHTSGTVVDDTMVIREGDDEYVSMYHVLPELHSSKAQKKQGKKIHKKKQSMAAGDYDLGDMTQEWYYVDPDTNELNGPYKASEFVEWQKNGDLHGDVQVIRSGESEYSSLHTRQRTLGKNAGMEGFGGSTLMANPLNVAGAGKKKYKKGDRCNAPFQEYGHYPATVVKVNGANTIVIFEGYEPDEATVPTSSLRHSE